jgi:hypothetical protein
MANQDRYVAMLLLPGSHLFCTDRWRDEWSGNLAFAETFRELHHAEDVARRHGGLALPWAEAHALAA